MCGRQQLPGRPCLVRGGWLACIRFLDEFYKKKRGGFLFFIGELGLGWPHLLRILYTIETCAGVRHTYLLVFGAVCRLLHLSTPKSKKPRLISCPRPVSLPNRHLRRARGWNVQSVQYGPWAQALGSGDKMEEAVSASGHLAVRKQRRRLF